MNRAPTELLVETAYMTMTMEGGISIPRAPEVAMTPVPKRTGNPCLTMAGSRMEPMATTVAGEDPETAANRAQARTAASPSPPW